MFTCSQVSRPCHCMIVLVMMMSILWWMLASWWWGFWTFTRTGAKLSFQLIWGTKQLLRPQVDIHHHVESSQMHTLYFSPGWWLVLSPDTGTGTCTFFWCCYWYFLLVLVRRVGGWSKHRCRVLTDHGLQSASWTKISSQQAGQRGGRHCGHHGGQSVGHVARTKKTPENSADKIIGHCGIVTKVQGWSLWTLSYFWTKVVMLQKDPKSSFNSTDICKFGSPKICKKNINYYVLFWFATYHGKTCNWPG